MAVKVLQVAPAADMEAVRPAEHLPRCRHHPDRAKETETKLQRLLEMSEHRLKLGITVGQAAAATRTAAEICQLPKRPNRRQQMPILTRTGLSAIM